MTTDNEINPNAYAVVYFGSNGSTPQICNGTRFPFKVNGIGYAVYDDADDAADEFKSWPNDTGQYGVLPVRLLIEEQARFVFKESALR